MESVLESVLALVPMCMVLLQHLQNMYQAELALGSYNLVLCSHYLLIPSIQNIHLIFYSSHLGNFHFRNCQLVIPIQNYMIQSMMSHLRNLCLLDDIGTSSNPPGQ